MTVSVSHLDSGKQNAIISVRPKPKHQTAALCPLSYTPFVSYMFGGVLLFVISGSYICPNARPRVQLLLQFAPEFGNGRECFEEPRCSNVSLKVRCVAVGLNIARLFELLLGLNTILGHRETLRAFAGPQHYFGGYWAPKPYSNY